MTVLTFCFFESCAGAALPLSSFRFLTGCSRRHEGVVEDRQKGSILGLSEGLFAFFPDVWNPFLAKKSFFIGQGVDKAMRVGLSP
jgi:hypothetical protein